MSHSLLTSPFRSFHSYWHLGCILPPPPLPHLSLDSLSKEAVNFLSTPVTFHRLCHRDQQLAWPQPTKSFRVAGWGATFHNRWKSSSLLVEKFYERFYPLPQFFSISNLVKLESIHNLIKTIDWSCDLEMVTPISARCLRCKQVGCTETLSP